MTSEHAAPGGADFFDAATYSQWVAGVLQAGQQGPASEILFDSTMREPTDALVSLICDGFANGPPPQYVSVFGGGNRQLVDLLAKRYALPPHWILPTTGVTAGLAMVLRALIGPDDEVLVEQPGFDLLTRLAQEAGATVRPLHRPAPDFGVDLQRMQQDLTPRTRAVILTNLHNPSGRRMTPAEIRAVAAQARTVGAWLIVDEVYDDFTRELGVFPAVTLAPNIISLNSLTKVYGLFALKCGWIAAPPEVLTLVQGGATEGDPGVAKLTHATAAMVLNRASLFEAHWRTTLTENREILAQYADKMIAEGLVEGAPPPFGCMYFPRIIGPQGVGQVDTIALGRRLWRDHGVIVAPGDYFGQAGYVRIGFGGDPAGLERGLQRLHEGLLAARRG